MNLMETIRLALAGVGSNKLRSFLTLLGIIIGVTAVILMVSLGSGTQKVVSGQFSNLQTRQIYIDENHNLPYHLQGRLSLRDRDYLKDSVMGVEKVVPFYQLYTGVKYGDNEQEGWVYGIDPASQELINVNISYGRFFDQSDIDNKERVAIVGEQLLERLARTGNMVQPQHASTPDYASAVGKYIYLSGKKFIIVGVMQESQNMMFISNQSVLLPYTTIRDHWRRETRYVDFYLLSYGPDASEKDTLEQVKYLMDRKYGKTSTGKSKFYFQSLQENVNIMTRVFTVFTYVLGGIASISLLVGGIGVMNIMLVTVKERTREIGVRLAIGATRQDVQRQFLAESVILSVGGGIVGVLMGSILSFLANMILKQVFNWWQGFIPGWVILLSFGVTTAIGVIFGFYPAYKASRLDPIEALRYE
ncbi:ABC transporter permease [Halothermothrix orenii]|uniref:ABC-type antimicrobial peptide transport system, permease component n=1 Tax=Halothermothrix orenii (strain H 168 / OCM 544 / DSM 9562) TaxID=373903 RepID=B8D149_HALOH|nr:ABC transporter permease [Halothermothrix orenii]ACL69018.1 ABC-type antimicrobial peptide transport system, permease component [Halothermothrix orenii H 168]